MVSPAFSQGLREIKRFLKPRAVTSAVVDDLDLELSVVALIERGSPTRNA